jgi:flagellar basal body rod protein FlgB
MDGLASRVGVNNPDQTMLFGFIGRVSDAPQLKESLDTSSQRVRAIAQRVAAASVPGQGNFALPEGEAGAESATANLESEMTALADEQLRYDAAAKLLEKAYTRIRLSLRNG